MSRPLPNNPPNQPLGNRQYSGTSPLPTGPPTSFKTNVNRAKTKRWVEAKSYSYDGDDWGDADEYDEYAGYDEPEPAANPPGVRQQGQHSVSGSGYNTGARTNSFSQEDDRRAFSAGYVGPPTVDGPSDQIPLRQGMPQGPSLRSLGDERYPTAPPVNPPPIQGIQGTYQPGPLPGRLSVSSQGGQPGASGQRFPPSGSTGGGPYPGPPRQVDNNGRTQSFTNNSVQRPPRQFDNSGRAQSITSNTFQGPRPFDNTGRAQSITSNISQDFQSRRDFTPSAMPPPLGPRNSPSPSNSTDPRPVRKSSLAGEPQFIAPKSSSTEPRSRAPSQILSGGVDPPPPPAPVVASPEEPTSKPLPFVRPADIYKRMQEEKEKERQSQETSRPSMDSIMRTESPAQKASTQLPAPSGYSTASDMSTAPSSQPRQNYEAPGQEIGSRRTRTPLDTVAERKSEYGMEGLPNRPRLPDVPHVSGFGESLLPDVTRISGFGESFLGSMSGGFGDSSTAEKKVERKQPLSSSMAPQVPDERLKHQPSAGFHSVVHQAFDEQVPQTPTSAAGSGLARTNSESTNGVSPVMSRAPSAATAEAKAREAEAREANIPVIAEEPTETSPRPLSDEPSTPKPIVRKASPGPVPAPLEPASKTFTPGHHRELSTSPSSSPARSPALETSQQLQQPEKAELAMTTPVEPITSSHDTFPEEESKTPQQTLSEFEGTEGNKFQNTDTASLVTEPPSLPRQDTEPSPLSGVLPDRGNSPPDVSPLSTVELSQADALSNNGMGHLAENFGPQVTGGMLPTPLESPVSRPGNERVESFRPRLPGGWDSYASTGRSSPQGLGIGNENRASTPISKFSVEPTTVQPASALGGAKIQEKEAGAANSQPSMAEALEPIAAPDPFSSLASAGTALASALVAAVGLNQDEPTPEKEVASTTTAHRNGDTEIRPEARPWRNVFDDTDADSSVAPTPLPKDTPLRRDTDQSTTSDPDYFPTIVPLRQKPRNSINTDNPETPTRPESMPSLSTETSPHDYESDRLRKEIVRELSPHLEHDRNREGFGGGTSQMHESTLSPTQSRIHGHDSMTLPSEYASYWDELGEDEDPTKRSSTRSSEPVHPGEEPMPTVPAKLMPPIPGQSMPSIVEKSMPPVPDSQMSSVVEKSMPPLPEQQLPTIPEKPMPAIPEQSLPTVIEEGPVKRHQPTDSESSLKVRPNVLAHRFSWEPMPEIINSPTRPDATQPMEPMEIIDRTPSQEPGPPVAKAGALRPSSLTSVPQKDVITRESMPQSAGLSQPNTPAKSSEVSTDHFDDESEPSIQRASLHLQKQTSVPPERTDMPLPSVPTEQPKLLTFAEIVALRDQTERIRTFNSTRKQFADMNTGLSAWITATLKDLPEHAHLAENGGRFTGGAYHRQTPSKGKLGGVRISSGLAQQPYYQQYLNASASSPTTTTGPTTPATQSTSIYQPSGGASSKISSAQVQAKGKDLLHSAGIFSGKANTAAKGFFSKGKQKFRSSGGGDKASSSPPPSSLDPSQKGMQQKAYLEPPESGMQSAFSTTSPEPTSTSTLNSLPGLPSEAQSAQKTSPRIIEVRDSPVATAPVGKKLDSQAIIGRIFGDATNAEVPPPPVLKSGPATSLDRDTTPAFLQQIPSVEPYGPTSVGLQSPRSATSSDKTPTQASFAKKFWRQGSDPSVEQAPETSSKLPVSPEENVNGEQHPKRLSKYEKITDAAIAGDDSVKPNAKPNKARTLPFYDKEIQIDSGSSDRKSSSAADSVASEAEHSRTTDDSWGIYKDDDMREAIAVKLLEAGETTQPPKRPLHAPQYTIIGGIGELDKGHSTKPSQDISLRRPSVDNRDPSFQNRPHSPVSPPQSLRNQPTQQAPIHYDTTHDFISQGPPSRDRRPYSRPFQDPNLHQHPAFRQENLGIGSIDWPEEYYPAGTSRGDLLPREEKTEYQLDGIGPPPAVEERSRNRRSFGPSTLLKRLSGTPAAEEEQNRVQPTPAPAPTPTPTKTEKKAKRGSFFKVLTSEKAENDKKEPATNSPQRSQVDTPSSRQPSANRADLATNRQFSSSNRAESPAAPGINVSASSSRSKLQRANTSGTPPAPQETGKKKRFSGLANLFSRSNQRQSTPPASRPSHPPQPSTQPSPYNSYNSRVAAPNSVSAYHANRHVSAIPVQQYPTAPPVDPYAPNPALEGYYSPDRSSPTFSPAFMSGQRSPRLVPQQTPPTNYQTNTQNTSPNTYSRNQQPTTINPGQWDLNQQSRDDDSFAPAPLASQSSWTRRVGRRSEGFPTPNHQASHQPSTGSPINQRTSGRPPQTYHEMGRSNTVSRNDSPPPPPPPKDDWHLASPQSTAPAAQVRATSATQPTTRSSYQPQPTPSSNPTASSKTHHRQTLPPLQTNVSTHARTVQSQESRETPKIQTPEELRRTRQKEIEMGIRSPKHLSAPKGAALGNGNGRRNAGNGGGGGGGGGRRSGESASEEEKIVMSSASYPGMEWVPSGVGGWEGE